MVFLAVSLAYLALCGFIVHKRDVCFDGAMTMLIGGVAVIGISALYQTHSGPRNPDTDPEIMCLRTGGEIIHKAVEYGGNHGVYEDCVKKCP